MGMFDLCVGRADQVSNDLWQRFLVTNLGFQGRFSVGLDTKLSFCPPSISPFYISASEEPLETFVCPFLSLSGATPSQGYRIL